MPAVDVAMFSISSLPIYYHTTNAILSKFAKIYIFKCVRQKTKQFNIAFSAICLPKKQKINLIITERKKNLQTTLHSPPQIQAHYLQLWSKVYIHL